MICTLTNIMANELRIRWAEHEASLRKARNSHTILVGKTDNGQPIQEVQESMQGDNISTDLKEIGWEAVDWIHLAQNRIQQRAHEYTLMVRVS